MIKNIIHLADIHVMKYKQHEYSKQVSIKTIKQIKSYKKKGFNKNNTRIVICGDIFDKKIHVTNELNNIVAKLLTELSTIFPLIIIAGNHDLNLSNTDRLDSITPIVTAINSKNITYLKHSTCYVDENIRWVCYSCLDNFKKPDCVLDNTKTNIGLFHDILPNSSNSNGYKLSSKHDMEMFEGCDVVLLGDVHKRQELYFNDSKGREIKCVYPSSLRQINKSETLERHGFLVWNVDTLEYDEVDVSHDYGFYNFDCEGQYSFTDGTYKLKNTVNDVDPTATPNITPNGVIYINVNINKLDLIKSVKEEIRNNFLIEFPNVNKKQVKLENITSSIKNELHTDSNVDVSGGLIEDIANYNIQVELIEEYCQLNDIPYDLDMLKRVNTEVEDVLEEKESYDIANRFNIYKHLNLYIKNFLSYEEETIQLDNYKGLTAVTSFPANEGGKTTLFKAISFLLFAKVGVQNEKYEKLFNDVLNEKKLVVRGEIYMKQYNYVIERTLTKGKTIKHNINFHKYHVDLQDQIISLNGATPKETQLNINKIFGSFNNWEISQRINIDTLKSVINTTSSEKNKLLSAHLGLELLDNKSSACKLLRDDFNKKATCKKYDVTTLKNQSESNKKEIVNFNTRLDENKSKIKELTHNKTILEQKIIDEKAKLHIVENYNVDTINKKILQTKKELDQVKQGGLLLKKNTPINPKFDLEKLNNTLNELNTEITCKTEKLGELNAEFKILNNSLKVAENVIECDRCGKIFKETADKINLIKSDIKDKDSEIYSIKLEISKLKNSKTSIDSNIETQNKYITDLRLNEQKIITKRDLYVSKKSVLDDLKTTLDKCISNEKMIEENNVTNRNINKLNGLLNNVSGEISAIKKDNEYLNNNLDNVTKKQREVKMLLDLIYPEIELEKAYTLYLKLYGRNGIGKLVVNKCVNLINEQLDMFLYGKVDFKITLENTEKNDYEFFFHETHGTVQVKRSLSMTSGWQLLCSCLSINFVLANISALPKSTTLSLDEILSSASEDNYEKIQDIIRLGAESYDNIFLISHNHQIQDWCDMNLEILKENGISKIVN